LTTTTFARGIHPRTVGVAVFGEAIYLVVVKKGVEKFIS